MIKKDALWKGIIEDLFEDFLFFFFPEESQNIDFDRGFDFLDKELHQLFPESKNQGRIADKLVKVFLLNGEEQWILIHIEVQGYNEAFFSKRMFTYFYRIYDKFERPITALAIFTDGDSLFHPNSYHLDFWDTSMIYRFRTFKVKNKKQEYFNKHPNNPFSIILEAVWIELQKGKAIDRSKLKIGITKKLLQSGLPKQKIERLYRFIHYYIRLHSKEEKLINLIYLIFLIVGYLGCSC